MEEVVGVWVCFTSIPPPVVPDCDIVWAMAGW